MLHFVNCIFHFPNDVAAVIVIDNILHAAKKKTVKIHRATQFV